MKKQSILIFVLLLLYGCLLYSALQVYSDIHLRYSITYNPELQIVDATISEVKNQIIKGNRVNYYDYPFKPSYIEKGSVIHCIVYYKTEYSINEMERDYCGRFKIGDTQPMYKYKNDNITFLYPTMCEAILKISGFIAMLAIALLFRFKVVFKKS